MLTGAVVTEKTAAERVRGRIKARLLHMNKDQEWLASALRISAPSVSEMLSPPKRRKRPERGLLHRLDDIAKALDMPPSYFIVKNERAVVELHGDEHKLIAHWRRLPKGVHRQVMDLFTFVAGLLPEEREERELWLMIRRLGSADRSGMVQLARDILQKRRTGAGTYTEPAGQASSPATEPATHSKLKKH
jgi:hypothetical protein